MTGPNLPRVVLRGGGVQKNQRPPSKIQACVPGARRSSNPNAIKETVARSIGGTLGRFRRNEFRRSTFDNI